MEMFYLPINLFLNDMKNKNDKKVLFSKKKLLIGRIMSGMVIVFLLFDGIIHIMHIAPVIAAFEQLGYPGSIAITIGFIELICLFLYIIPQTSVLGAILLTGYLGGAVASNVRIGNPLFSHVLFPVYVGVLLWGGLYFRKRRLRLLISWKNEME
jgi:hypothetical protein